MASRKPPDDVERENPADDVERELPPESSIDENEAGGDVENAATRGGDVERETP